MKTLPESKEAREPGTSEELRGVPPRYVQYAKWVWEDGWKNKWFVSLATLFIVATAALQFFLSAASRKVNAPSKVAAVSNENGAATVINQSKPLPTIEITKLPRILNSEHFDADSKSEIAGQVIGEGMLQNHTNYSVIVYVRTRNPGKDPWFLQPTFDSPPISVGPDGMWNTETRLGFEYAAILINKNFGSPPRTLAIVPLSNVDKGILAVVKKGEKET